jgi:hypothetical protein
VPSSASNSAIGLRANRFAIQPLSSLGFPIDPLKLPSASNEIRSITRLMDSSRE